MAYKNKFLVVKEKPFNTGFPIAQINVSLLNKKGINLKWDELQKEYPKDKYIVSLTETNNPMREFVNPPKTN